ncbi:hypothetical protein [Eshraghiella crossota]
MKSAGLAAQTKADIIPIHMEHEQGELESEEQNTRNVRMEQFKAITGSR